MRNAWSFIQMENPVTLGKVEGEIVSSQNLSLGRILTWCNLFLWIGTGHRVFSPLYWTLAISSFSSSLRYSHSPLFQLPPLLSLPPPTHTLTYTVITWNFWTELEKKGRRQGKNLSYLGLPPIPSQDYEVNQSGPRDIPLGSAFY